MSQIDDLQLLLKKLPGIGPRQARRFVYFLLSADSSYIHRLTTTLAQLREEKSLCSFCKRLYFTSNKNTLCQTCADTKRNLHKVLIIEKNSDFENFERSGVWDGRYFLVLKNIGITEDVPEQRLGLENIITEIETGDITEVVTALSVNPDGEYTTDFVHKALRPYVETHTLSLSSLARGLSTGSEIEYADSETLRQALENRK